MKERKTGKRKAVKSDNSTKHETALGNEKFLDWKQTFRNLLYKKGLLLGKYETVDIKGKIYFSYSVVRRRTQEHVSFKNKYFVNGKSEINPERLLDPSMPVDIEEVCKGLNVDVDAEDEVKSKENSERKKNAPKKTDLKFKSFFEEVDKTVIDESFEAKSNFTWEMAKHLREWLQKNPPLGTPENHPWTEVNAKFAQDQRDRVTKVRRNDQKKEALKTAKTGSPSHILNDASGAHDDDTLPQTKDYQVNVPEKRAKISPEVQEDDIEKRAKISLEVQKDDISSVDNEEAEPKEKGANIMEISSSCNEEVVSYVLNDASGHAHDNLNLEDDHTLDDSWDYNDADSAPSQVDAPNDASDDAAPLNIHGDDQVVEDDASVIPPFSDEQAANSGDAHNNDTLNGNNISNAVVLTEKGDDNNIDCSVGKMRNDQMDYSSEETTEHDGHQIFCSEAERIGSDDAHDDDPNVVDSHNQMDDNSEATGYEDLDHDSDIPSQKKAKISHDTSDNSADSSMKTTFAVLLSTEEVKDVNPDSNISSSCKEYTVVPEEKGENIMDNDHSNDHSSATLSSHIVEIQDISLQLKVQGHPNPQAQTCYLNALLQMMLKSSSILRWSQSKDNSPLRIVFQKLFQAYYDSDISEEDYRKQYADIVESSLLKGFSGICRTTGYGESADFFHYVLSGMNDDIRDNIFGKYSHKITQKCGKCGLISHPNVPIDSRSMFIWKVAKPPSQNAQETISIAACYEAGVYPERTSVTKRCNSFRCVGVRGNEPDGLGLLHQVEVETSIQSQPTSVYIELARDHGSKLSYQWQPEMCFKGLDHSFQLRSFVVYQSHHLKACVCIGQDCWILIDDEEHEMLLMSEVEKLFSEKAVFCAYERTHEISPRNRSMIEAMIHKWQTLNTATILNTQVARVFPQLANDNASIKIIGKDDIKQLDSLDFTPGKIGEVVLQLKQEVSKVNRSDEAKVSNSAYAVPHTITKELGTNYEDISDWPLELTKHSVKLFAVVTNNLNGTGCEIYVWDDTIQAFLRTDITASTKKYSTVADLLPRNARNANRLLQFVVYLPTSTSTNEITKKYFKGEEQRKMMNSSLCLDEQSFLGEFIEKMIIANKLEILTSQSTSFDKEKEYTGILYVSKKPSKLPNVLLRSKTMILVATLVDIEESGSYDMCLRVGQNPNEQDPKFWYQGHYQFEMPQSEIVKWNSTASLFIRKDMLNEFSEVINKHMNSEKEYPFTKVKNELERRGLTSNKIYFTMPGSSFGDEYFQSIVESQVNDGYECYAFFYPKGLGKRLRRSTKVASVSINEQEDKSAYLFLVVAIERGQKFQVYSSCEEPSDNLHRLLTSEDIELVVYTNKSNTSLLQPPMTGLAKIVKTPKSPLPDSLQNTPVFPDDLIQFLNSVDVRVLTKAKNVVDCTQLEEDEDTVTRVEYNTGCAYILLKTLIPKQGRLKNVANDMVAGGGYEVKMIFHSDEQSSPDKFVCVWLNQATLQKKPSRSDGELYMEYEKAMQNAILVVMEKKKKSVDMEKNKKSSKKSAQNCISTASSISGESTESLSSKHPELFLPGVDKNYIVLEQTPLGKTPNEAISIANGDCKYLNDDTMINDSLMDLMREMDKHRSNLSEEQFHDFSALFFAKLTEGQSTPEAQYALVKHWTNQVDIFTKRIIFFPIYQSSHFYLVCFVRPDLVMSFDKLDLAQKKNAKASTPEVVSSKGTRPCILIANSLPSNEIHDPANAVVTLKKYVASEWLNKTGRAFVGENMDQVNVDFVRTQFNNIPVVVCEVPHQGQTNHCALYVNGFIKYIKEHIVDSNVDSISTNFSRELAKMSEFITTAIAVKKRRETYTYILENISTPPNTSSSSSSGSTSGSDDVASTRSRKKRPVNAAANPDSELRDHFKRYEYAVAKSLFSFEQVQEVINLVNEGLQGVHRSYHDWRNVQGEARRQYRKNDFVGHADQTRWIRDRVESGSEGIIDDKLTFDYASLIRSLRGCGKQAKHIDAGSKEMKGVSVMMALMEGTYLISYMNGQTESIYLDVGDVMYWSNAFEHGGQDWPLGIKLISCNPFHGCTNTHCRLFFRYRYIPDNDHIEFKRL